MERPEGYGGDLAFMAVADDGKNSGQSGNFIRRALRITPSDYDASLRVAALDAANVGTGVAIGFRGDRAGVDNHDIWRCADLPGRRQGFPNPRK